MFDVKSHQLDNIQSNMVGSKFNLLFFLVVVGNVDRFVRIGHHPEIISVTSRMSSQDSKERNLNSERRKNAYLSSFIFMTSE